MIRKPRRWRRWLLLAVVLYAAAGVVIAELYMHPPRHRVEGPPGQDIALRAPDGVLLKASLVRPRKANGDAVILLHGVAANRLQTLGHAEMFQRHGYTLLLPDARAHGNSEGRASFGLVERHDLRLWADWLTGTVQAQCLYGFGESMGAGILLQAVAIDDRYCAVAVDSPFADLRDAGIDRLSEPFRLSPWAATAVLWLPVTEAMLWAHWRTGLDWSRASPREAVAHTNVPVLAIHGTADRNIRPEHSRALHDANPARVTLWEVAGAGHAAARRVAGAEYERRVIAWFQKWRRLQPAR